MAPAVAAADAGRLTVDLVRREARRRGATVGSGELVGLLPESQVASPDALALDSLPASFHGDPADRLIVATARAHALPLATHDTAIRRSRTVKLWKP